MHFRIQYRRPDCGRSDSGRDLSLTPAVSLVWRIARGCQSSPVASGLAQNPGDRQSEAAELNLQGIDRYQQGQWQAALAVFEQSRQISRELGDLKAEGYALFNIGKAYEKLGHKELALDFYWEVLEIADQIGNKATSNAEYQIFCQTEFGAELCDPENKPIDCLGENNAAAASTIFDEDDSDNIIVEQPSEDKGKGEF